MSNDIKPFETCINNIFNRQDVDSSVVITTISLFVKKPTFSLGKQVGETRLNIDLVVAISIQFQVNNIQTTRTVVTYTLTSVENSE